MRRKFYVLMAEADVGEGGGAGGGSTGASAGTAPAYGAPVQGQAVGIPEKFQVKKEDGSLDFEASSVKLAENYAQLEKRLGAGDIPPRSADDYQISVPDTVKGDWDPKSDPVLSSFLKDAHEAGFTQGQVDFVLGKYFELAPQLFSGVKQYSAEASTAQLRQEWKTDEQFQAELGKAFKAAQAYGDKDAQDVINEYGNDPRLIRFLARVGGQMAEDRSIGNLCVSSGPQSAQSAMMSEAYNNAKHPDHARVSAQVAAHFAKQARGV